MAHVEVISNQRDICISSDFVDVNVLASVRHQVVSKALASQMEAFEAQHKALNAEAYRITLKDRNGNRSHVYKGHCWSMGVGAKGAVAQGTPVQVLDAVKSGALARANAQGFDIYITPLSAERHFILVDDIKGWASVETLKNEYVLSLVQTSSQDNFQAVIQVQKQAGQDEQRAANDLLKSINARYGDPKMQGVVRPFRCAGFRNKKEGKGGVLTTVLPASKGPVLDQKATLQLEQYRENHAESDRHYKKQILEVSHAVAVSKIERAPAPPLETSHRLHTSDLYSSYAKVTLSWVEKRGLETDWSVVDFEVAKAMFKAGYAPVNVTNAIRDGRPDGLKDKGNPEDYLRRTVERAHLEVISAYKPPKQAQRSDAPVCSSDPSGCG